MTLTYTEEDLANPIGANGLSAQAMFFQRALYRQKIYPHTAGSPAPLDTWYTKPLFGRIDSLQNTVTPQFAMLKRIERAINPKIYALNFVTYAFRDFVNHIEDASVLARLAPGGNTALVNIKATSGYASPDIPYNNYRQTLINSYITSLPEERNVKIIDFASFCEDFLGYVLFMAQTYPVTKSNFLLGNFVSPACSGLSIKISLDPADKDGVKAQKFLRDLNFPFYAKCAKKFGFLVNKNMPWVLTADLFSSVIRDRLAPWFVDNEPASPDNFFRGWYDFTYKTDILDIRSLFVSGYQALLNQKLYYQNKTIVCDKELEIVVLSRQPYDEEDAPRVLTPNFLINLYVNLRQTESKNALSPTHVGQIKRKAILLYRSSLADNPYEDAAEHINSIYRDYIYSESSLELITNSWVSLDAAPNTGYTVGESVAIDPYAQDEDYEDDALLYPEFEDEAATPS